MTESTRGTRTTLVPFEPMVKSIARRYLAVARSTRVLELDDLLAVGRLAVLDALRTHDAAQGSVRTWASRLARQRIIDEIRRHAPCRKWAPEDRPRVVDLPLRLCDAHPLPDEAAELAGRTARLLEAIAQLPRDLGMVIRLRLSGLTLREVGQRFDVGEARAYQLQREAVSILQRSPLGAAEVRHG